MLRACAARKWSPPWPAPEYRLSFSPPELPGIGVLASHNRRNGASYCATQDAHLGGHLRRLLRVPHDLRTATPAAHAGAILSAFRLGNRPGRRGVHATRTLARAAR